MVTEEQRTALNRWFKTDTHGMPHKVSAKCDALDLAALLFAKCVMESCDPLMATTDVCLEHIRDAHRLATRVVK